ncbi:dihydropteroate synthase [Anaplasma bovis]|uniref:dihydropteroate synthase n=1 Tax=Anaplasma bovis TaxID=186733 RepID=UPI002FF290A3
MSSENDPLDHKTKIVGILNVTPNSFSDGGQFLEPEKALAHAYKLIEDGADVIDVGAESTAPDAVAISVEEEQRRLEEVLPQVIEAAHSAKVEVSIDTRNASTASIALRAGVDYVNDQGGLSDPNMVPVIRESHTKVVVMHSLGLPVSRSRYSACSPEDLMREIIEWLRARVDTLVSNGVHREDIIVDPGIGFGKLPEHSWYIMRNIRMLSELGVKTYVGHSRKSPFSSLSIPLTDRDVPTAIVSAFLMQQGVDFIRVHNVEMTKLARDISRKLQA